MPVGGGVCHLPWTLKEDGQGTKMSLNWAAIFLKIISDFSHG